MITIRLLPGADEAGFRTAVRRLLHEEVHPSNVFWTTGADDLFPQVATIDAPPVSLPRAFADLVLTVICHSDPERHALLYQLAWRLRHGEPHLCDLPTDPLTHRLHRMKKAIRREIHKMHAFVRFRRAPGVPEERFVAWFEPAHFILEAAAPFFVDRFHALDWMILTPIGRVCWNRRTLQFGPPGRQDEAPAADPFEDGWAGYYQSAFNPARTNPDVMRAEMPKRYWRNLPEARAIPEMIRDAWGRTRDMVEKEAVMPARRMPEKAVAAMADQAPASLEALNALIARMPPMVEGCTGAVLGEGPIGATIAFVGEQPGDEEDRTGHPFVGPAGKMFDRALAEVGIDRQKTYVTNAVKHFKFVQRGKRRLHQKPTAGEVKHYRWWLLQEMDLVAPRLVVALGATAALALSGRAVAVTANRGPATLDGRDGFITVHPSYLLRLPGESERAEAWRAFVSDLAQVRDMAA